MREGEILKNPKNLKRKHKIFLKNQGCNPDDFMIISEGPDYYKFYNKINGAVFELRR